MRDPTTDRQEQKEPHVVDGSDQSEYLDALRSARTALAEANSRLKAADDELAACDDRIVKLARVIEGLQGQLEIPESERMDLEWVWNLQRKSRRRSPWCPLRRRR